MRLVAPALLVLGCYSPRVQPGDDGAPAGDGLPGDGPGPLADGISDAALPDVLLVDAAKSCAAMADGTPCVGGLCHDGACDTASCYVWGAWWSDGTGPSGACFACDVTADRTDFVQRRDGDSCTSAGTSGQCWSGACCTGCWNGSLCRPGTTELECGREGNLCTTCIGSCYCDSTGCPTQHDRYDMWYCVSGACTYTSFTCCGPTDGTCSASAPECSPSGCSP